MISNNPKNDPHTNRLHILLITATTIAAVLFNLYCLSSGLLALGQNGLFIPIILSCMYYTMGGFIYSVCLAVLYMLFILIFTSESTLIAQASVRAAMFIGIAGVVTFLSIRHKRATQKLRENAETFRRLFEDSTDPILLLDREVVVDCNSAGVAILGRVSKQEVINKHPWEFSPPFQPDGRLSAEKAADMMDIAIGEGHYRFEWIYLKSDGTEFPVEAMLTPLIVQGRQLFHVVWRDIAERKRAQEALQESEAKYRRLFEDAVLGVFQSTPDGKIIAVNGAYARMFGYTSPDELMTAVSDVALSLYADPTRRPPIVEMITEAGQSVRIENMYKRKDGSFFAGNLHAWSVRNSKGELTLEGFVEDITERKRMEEEIIKEKSKLKTLSDNAPFGMVLINKDGCFAHINPKFTELFGFNLSDIPDAKTWLRKAFPGVDYRHTVISGWAEEFRDAKPGAGKPRICTVTCKDGTEKIVSFVTSVLVSGDYLMACEDVTDLKLLESQLRQAQKLEAVGTLTGGIAHDFNNILTVITGFGTLLEMNMEEASPLRIYVDQILSASEKAAQLTQTLLAFSRQQPMVLKPVNINEVIRGTEKLLNRLVIEDIVVRTVLSPDEIIVMADATQIEQIFFNLATNARDAMPRGGVLTIATKSVELDEEFRRSHGYGEPGRYAFLSVSDTGTGMDEATKAKIFDPFFTTKEVGKGTGLGLSSVYGTVKQHQGYITVESEPGMGTIFHIYLPVVTKGADEEKPVPLPLERGSATVLVAEDNQALRGLFRDVLTAYGYRVIEATDGADAVQQFKKTDKIDLLILDSVMPKKNGREAYNEIHDIKPGIKVLFTSGYTRDVVLDKGVEDKVFDFIAKPISPSALLQKVREVLDK